MLKACDHRGHRPWQEVVGEYYYRCSGKQTSDQTDCEYAMFRPADELCSWSWRKMILLAEGDRLSRGVQLAISAVLK